MAGNDLYAGGWFTNAGGVAANCIAKWDGSSWSALGSGISGVVDYDTSHHSNQPYVYALAVAGSDLYVSGNFAKAGGVSATIIAKWNGSRWSALGSGIGRTDGNSAIVYALAVSGSDLYAGGRFTTAGGRRVGIHCPCLPAHASDAFGASLRRERNGLLANG